MKSKIHQQTEELRKEIKYKYAQATGGIRLYPGRTITEIHVIKRMGCRSWDKTKRRWVFNLALVDWDSDE